MFDGWGESITYEFASFNKGWLLKILIFILFKFIIYLYSNKINILLKRLLLIYFNSYIYNILYILYSILRERP